MTLMPEQIQALIKMIQDTPAAFESMRNITSIDEASAVLLELANTAGMAIDKKGIKTWLQKAAGQPEELSDGQLDAVAAGLPFDFGEGLGTKWRAICNMEHSGPADWPAPSG